MQDQEKRQYPPIEYIELKPFYSWIIENHLLFPMHPKNSYQKAINNLSYVHGEDNEISRFIYQMRILEGIYTKENNNQITEQLNTKIPLFLGSIQAFKKQIKEMYDIRSKFLHGTSVAVPFHKTHQVDFDYLSSFDHAVAVASSTSILLAISTLQKMYLNDFVELDFNYHVSGKKGNAE